MPTRVVFDTNVYNRIADTLGAADGVRLAIAKDRIQLIETHLQEDQLEATTCDERRTLLKRVLESIPGEKGPTEVIVWDVSKWDQANFSDDATTAFYEDVLAGTKRGQPRHAIDAALATTALRKAEVFVTTDAPLAKRTKTAVEAIGATLRVLTFDEFLAEFIFPNRGGSRRSARDALGQAFCFHPIWVHPHPTTAPSPLSWGFSRTTTPIPPWLP
jgi:hypothetical protein